MSKNAILNRSRLMALMLSLPFLGTARMDSQMNVHARVRSYRFCEVSDHTVALRISFDVTLSNQGIRAVTVYPPIQPLILISRTRLDMRQGKHEFELYPPMRPPLTSLDQPQGAKTAAHAINPGEVFHSTTVEVAIPFNGVEKRQDVLIPGSHQLQVVLEAQTGGPKDFIHARSQLITLKVESTPKVQVCSD